MEQNIEILTKFLEKFGKNRRYFDKNSQISKIFVKISNNSLAPLPPSFRKEYIIFVKLFRIWSRTLRISCNVRDFIFDIWTNIRAYNARDFEPNILHFDQNSSLYFDANFWNVYQNSEHFDWNVQNFDPHFWTHFIAQLNAFLHLYRKI